MVNPFRIVEMRGTVGTSRLVTVRAVPIRKPMGDTRPLAFVQCPTPGLTALASPARPKEMLGVKWRQAKGKLPEGGVECIG